MDVQSSQFEEPNQQISFIQPPYQAKSHGLNEKQFQNHKNENKIQTDNKQKQTGKRSRVPNLQSCKVHELDTFLENNVIVESFKIDEKIHKEFDFSSEIK